jgi:lipoprotein-anchoring transpeptidase ErfK/SrfK
MRPFQWRKKAIFMPGSYCIKHEWKQTLRAGWAARPSTSAGSRRTGGTQVTGTRTFGLIASLGLALAASAANAGSIAAAGARPAAPANALLQHVQYREADVFYDRQGNEVLVDRATGEVISVRPVRRPMRRVQRERAWEGEDGLYDDDPDATARLRRDWEEEFGPAPQRGLDDYDAYPEDDAFPEAPRSNSRSASNDPDGIRREPLAPATRQTEPDVLSQPSVPAGGATIGTPGGSVAREDVAGLQILLDRAGASPGVIDGRFGSNVDKAILAYRALTGRNLKSTDTALIKEQLAATGGDPFTSYTITSEDAAGPYVASVPADYGAKAKLERLSFTSVPEMLGERFHMDENYLKALNPEANFNRVGTIIKVANVGQPIRTQVAKIIADKGNKQVRAYDALGKLAAIYPATIGSTDTPSPTGTHAVSRIAVNPEYTYNPKINFKQGENDKVLTIPPGPNGPVGSIWIALDKPTYGIHGTPDPSKIGKTESHGCVRLTNWDAAELAKVVKAGVPVEFLE